jgi:hypothetical protein
VRLSGETDIKINDRAMGLLVLKLGLSTRYLRQQLTSQGVRVSVSDGCVEGLVRNANKAVLHTRRTDEPYFLCLRRRLDSRARFILLWTTTDERFECEDWGELVSIVRKYALPRPWKQGPKGPGDIDSQLSATPPHPTPGTILH